jgi:hypothetical protein
MSGLMATTFPDQKRVLATSLTPQECGENALRSLAQAMKAKDRHSSNRFKKAAEAWQELVEELFRDK